MFKFINTTYKILILFLLICNIYSVHLLKNESENGFTHITVGENSEAQPETGQTETIVGSSVS